MSNRPDKVAHAILREVSAVIQRDLQDPHIGFVTITRVDVSPDLRNALLHVSVLGAKQDVDESIAHLQRALSYIRRRITPRLALRYAPKLSVVHDDTELKAERLEQIIDELEISPEDESGPPADSEKA